MNRCEMVTIRENSGSVRTNVATISHARKVSKPLSLSTTRRRSPSIYSKRLFLKAVVIIEVRQSGGGHGSASSAKRACAGGAARSAQDGRAARRHKRKRLLRDTERPTHSGIDTQPRWTKVGWHGWVHGYNLHLVAAVGAVCLSLAAELTAACVADNELTIALLDTLHRAALFMFGNTTFNDAALREHGRPLVGQPATAMPKPTPVTRFVTRSTGCTQMLSRTSTAGSRATLTSRDGSELAGSSRPSAMSWARCWSTNLPSDIAS